jgi:hypothetical protein
MNDWQLPPELENLERELTSRHAPLPPVEFRQRITSTMRNRLRRERRQDFWNFAAAAAIVAGVWLNLSMSAVSETDFHFHLSDNRPLIEQTTKEIQKLLPEMSAEDAHREALLLCVGGNLVMSPRTYIPTAALNQVIDTNSLLP